MNTEGLSNKPRRGYDNTLREEQARQTRQRILDSAVEMLAASDSGNVTLAEVARRAGVSEPTLYRHFGSRERLYEALEAHAQVKLGLPAVPETMEEITSHVRAVFRSFGENDALMHAVTRADLGREIRARGRARRTQQLRSMIAAQARHLDGPEVNRITAVIRVLVSWETYRVMTEELGLSAGDAGAAVTWALETLLADFVERDAGGADSRRRVGERTSEEEA